MTSLLERQRANSKEEKASGQMVDIHNHGPAMATSTRSALSVYLTCYCTGHWSCRIDQHQHQHSTIHTLRSDLAELAPQAQGA